jgi:hypothetical protein
MMVMMGLRERERHLQVLRSGSGQRAARRVRSRQQRLADKAEHGAGQRGHTSEGQARQAGRMKGDDASGDHARPEKNKC